MSITIDSTDFVEALEGEPSLRFSDEKQQANFELGVSMAIHSWDALSIAVSNQWGGAQSEDKRDWITAIVIELFEEKIVDVQLIEDTILNAMVDEFDVNVEDDSSLPIADTIIKFYRQVTERDYSKIHALYNDWKLKKDQKSHGKIDVHIHEDPQNPDVSDDEDEDDDDEEIPTLQNEPIDEDVEMGDSNGEPKGPIIDDDGFELVQKKGRKRH